MTRSPARRTRKAARPAAAAAPKRNKATGQPIGEARKQNGKGTRNVPTAQPGTPSGQKLAEIISGRIEMRIIDANWPIGEVLGSEAGLLEEYGVSRAALREAVRLLEHHNVAYMRRGPGGGLVVAEPDPEAVTRAAAVFLRYREVSTADLFEARIALETAAVRSAAEHINEEGIAKLRDALDHERSIQSDEVDATIHDFHTVVAELSGNSALHLFIDVLTQLTAARFQGTMALFDRKGATRRSTDEEMAMTHAVHSLIADAIIAGDGALAQYRTQSHLRAMAVALKD